MATSPPTNVKPTAPAGGSGWVLEAKGNDPGSLNISRDISTGANQSITVRPGTQFRMKPSGKSKVDKNAETAQTAKWGDDLLVTVPGGGQVLLKGFYYKSPNAPPSKMVIEQKNGMLRKVEGRPGAEPSDSPNPTAQEDKDGNTVAGALIGGKGSSSSSSSAGGGSGGGKPYQEGGYKQSSEKVAKKGNKKSDEEDAENSGGFFSWLASGGVNSLGALGLLGLSGAKKDSGTTVNVSVPSTSSGSSSTIPAVSSLRISDDTGASSSDLITKTASQTVSGTLSTSLLSGQTVKVSTDNGSTWTTATATTGSTTFSLSGATLSGSSTLMAKAVNTSLAEGTSLSKAYVLDTTSPTATLTTGTYANTANATVQSSETGAAYLVNNTIIVTNEASITSASGTSWNSVAISAANTNTLLSLTGLVDGSYKLYTVDAAGNMSAVSTNTFTVNAAATGLTTSVTRLQLSADTGISPTDRITKTASQTVSGDLSAALAAYESVYITADGGSNWYAATASTGSTSFSLSGISLEVGANNTLKAKVMNTSTSGSSVEYSIFYTLDTTVPTVSSVAFSGATGAQNNFLNAGDVVSATATFSEAVTVTTTNGTPYLNLNVGGTTVQAAYASGSGTTTLIFSYTILSGQTDANGVSIDTNSLNLNNGSITDTAGNTATLTHTAVSDNASYMVDTTAPTTTVSTVVFSADTGTSGSDFVTATAAQDISGTLSANLASGETVYVSLNNGSTWTAATATVGQNTYSLTGQTLTSSNTLKVKITDAAGNSGTVLSQAYVLDAAVPTVSSSAITSATGAINNTLNAGDVVIATATFTEAVTVVTTGGTPYLNLNIGGTTVQAAYASGSGTTALTFTYTVLSGQTDANGISIDLNSLNLNSGTIKDAAGNSATITNTAVTDNASYMVDTTKPLAPTLALGSGVSDGATSTEAKQSSGVVTVSAETGASTVVTFSRIGGGTVTKTVTGTGSPMGVSLLDADLTTLGIGTINVTAVATDLAGNASNSATSSFTYDNYVSPAGNAVINLNSYGNLIAPVQVEGSWYYYWDRSGDGVWGAADRISYFTLNGIFTSSTVTLNGVQVALPSLTISVANENRNQAGTSYSDAGSTTNGTSSATYDSLLAIWDAYNGTGTDTNISGVPTNWAPNNYWSSTYKTNNNGPLNYITLNTGYVGNDEDNALMYAALRVLPIVVDLNHDGSFNYGNVVMDVNGDGLLDATRWVGGQDGVLVWDKYHDGLVHDNSQYAFAQYDNMSAAQGKTATDLSGLAAAFDTNHDGVFDAQDAQFADFKVWQDANQDGVSDAGEVKTLAELGLSSFQLSSDGVARTPEVGVHEAGRTSASATDGSQVLVADVGFDFGTLAKLDLSADPVANTLALHLDDLLANPHLTLVVQGDANDAVKLQGDGWVNSGSTVTLGDHHYTVWNNSTAQLLIDQQLVNNGRVL